MSGRKTAYRRKGRVSKGKASVASSPRSQPQKRKGDDDSSCNGSPAKSPRTSLDYVSPSSSPEAKQHDKDKQKEKVKALERTIEEQKERIEDIKRKLSAERRAKEDALTRLSSLASNRLRHNNPGITDLSDPNRPLKLAERISELYDNQWTNVMEELEMLRSFKPSKSQNQQAEIFDINLLRSIFTGCFNICHEEAKKQLQSLPHHAVMPSLVLIEMEDIPDLPDEMYKMIKDFRKNQSSKTIKELQPIVSKIIKEKLKIAPAKYKACDTYIDECIAVCWLMAVQDPPMFMQWDYETDTSFDSKTMRAYTRSGELVDYVVWPTLYLHQNGPLLAKGVVQGKKRSQKE